MHGKLLKRPVFEYDQALQVLQLLSIDAINPYIASLFAIIFRNSDNKEYLKQIKNWLYAYISPLLYTDPRGQVEVREKTLAISVYLFLEDINDKDHLLPSDSLINYIDYAIEQDWYDYSYLAFFCGFLTDRKTIHENVMDYFLNKFPIFLNQKNIEGLSQAIFHLTDLDEHQKALGLSAITKIMENPYSESFERSWGLISISTSVDQKDSDLQNKLKNELYKEIARINTNFFTIAISSLPKNNSQIEHIPFLENNQRNNQESSSIDFDDDNLSPIKRPDIAELGILTLSLLLSNYHQTMNLTGISEDEVNEFINTENKKGRGFILISKPAYVIGNLLALLFTLFIGVLICIFLFGIKIETKQIRFTSTPTISDGLLLITWADFLFSQIQAIHRGESALEGMITLPLIRHLIPIGHRKEDL